jgi:hypothetical protein
MIVLWEREAGGSNPLSPTLPARMMAAPYASRTDRPCRIWAELRV